MNKEPSNCDLCNASLDNGYCYTYKGSELVGAHCFECDRLKVLQEYKETRILKTRLLTNNILDLMQMGRSFSYTEKDTRNYRMKRFTEIVEQGTAEEIEEVRLQLEIRASFMRGLLVSLKRRVFLLKFHWGI